MFERLGSDGAEAAVVERDGLVDAAVAVSVDIDEGRSCLLQTAFALAGLFLHVTIYNAFLFFIMNPGRSRNFSLKNLPSRTRREEDPLSEKLKHPKVLPTIAEHREQSRIQAKELSLNINKFKTNLHRSSEESSDEELIRNAFYVIKSFGEVDNNFKALFVDIQARVKDYLFINDAELCHNYKIMEGSTYKRAIWKVDKINREIICQQSKAIQQLQQRLDQIDGKYLKQLESQEGQIHFLKQEVEKYKKMANIEYVRSLEDKVEELKEIISNQEEDYRELVKKNQDLSHDALQIQEALIDQQLKTSNLEAKIYDLAIFKEQSEVHLFKIKDRFEELAARMESMKAIIQKVEAENETLVSERVQLVNRAAVTFEDLTPRPKYSSFFAIDPSKFILPTRKITDILIDQLPGNKQEFCNKYFLSQKNHKLMECQAIREKTVEDINQIQNQLSRLVGQKA